MSTRQRSGPSEKEWQSTLVDLLEVFGYVVEHTYPLRTEHGWRTGSTLKGKPDLIAVRPPRILAIECKVDREKPTAHQIAVLTLYSLIPNARAWVLRDSDPWDDIQAWVRNPKASPRVYGFTPVDQLAAFRTLATARQRGPR
jgi:hypothetical protein